VLEGLRLLHPPAKREGVPEEDQAPGLAALPRQLVVAQTVGVDAYRDVHQPPLLAGAVHVADARILGRHLELGRVARHLDVVKRMAREVDAQAELRQQQEGQQRDDDDRYEGSGTVHWSFIGRKGKEKRGKVGSSGSAGCWRKR
jgi:hypothetical protein